MVHSNEYFDQKMEYQQTLSVHFCLFGGKLEYRDWKMNFHLWVYFQSVFLKNNYQIMRLFVKIIFWIFFNFFDENFRFDINVSRK